MPEIMWVFFPKQWQYSKMGIVFHVSKIEVHYKFCLNSKVDAKMIQEEMPDVVEIKEPEPTSEDIAEELSLIYEYEGIGEAGVAARALFADEPWLLVRR